jgi:hypothetical protein
MFITSQDYYAVRRFIFYGKKNSASKIPYVDAVLFPGPLMLVSDRLVMEQISHN